MIDSLKGLTEEERFHALVHVDLSTTDGNIIRGFALALASERRENARLQKMLDICNVVHEHNVRIVAERKHLQSVNADLLAACEAIVNAPVMPPWEMIQDAIKKAKGE